MSPYQPENNVAVKILRNLVLVLVVIVFASSIYNFHGNETKTNVALMADATASKSFRGVFVRSEEVIRFSGEGALSYNVSDGGKVGKDTVIANVYSSDEQIEINNQISALQKRLETLNKIQNPGTLESAQPATLSDSINESYRSLIYSRDMHDYASIKSDMDELLVQMSTYQIITNEVSGFGQQIIDIKNKIVELSESSSKPKEVITSEKPAYFVSYSDGYEETLTPEKLSELTINEIRQVTDSKVHDDTVVGKLMDGYGWYLVGIVDNSKKEYLSGDYVKLRFDSTADTFSAEITEIRNEGNPAESIFIIYCSQFNYDLVQHRVENVEIIKGDYRGLKVPREAIRFADVTKTVVDEQTGEESEITENCKGVYVLKGEQITFREIDVIYEGSDYVLSGVHDESGYLALYDDIIIEGVSTDG